MISFVRSICIILNILIIQLSNSFVNTSFEDFIKKYISIFILAILIIAVYKTFDSISKFAELLSKAKGDGFNCRVTDYAISENTQITIIEPPCGSNTAIIKSNGEYLFIDCGYACYRDEMSKLIHEIVPDFDRIRKRILITHADLDHCGLLADFDEIYASAATAECIALEHEGSDLIHPRISRKNNRSMGKERAFKTSYTNRLF